MDEMADKVALAVNQALAYVDARTGAQTKRRQRPYNIKP